MNEITKKNFSEFYDRILPYLNGKAHSGFTPVGTIISVMGKTAPMNYLACDGTVYNIADYTELAAYFNAQFGSSNFFGGDGTTTFAVPDLRGEFLRGTGTNSHANQGSGANVGVHQDGTNHVAFGINQETGDIWVQTSSTNHQDSSLYEVGADSYGSLSDLNGRYWRQTGTFAGNGVGTYTSHPTNTSVLYCIASKNIFMDAGSNYSTEEQVVGTWIDGSTIYQKTFDCGYLPNNSQKNIAHGLSNLNKIVGVTGIAISPNGAGMPLPYANINTQYNVELGANPTNIVFTTAYDFSNRYAYVTLRYIKTS